MFGKLSLNAIPHDPIVLTTLVGAIFGGIVVLALLTKFKLWGYLWKEWFTSVDHKKIGAMYLIVAFVMLLRGFSDAIMMRAQQALAAGGAEGYLNPHHFDQVFTAHGVIMIFFVAMPLITGLMNLVVPLQIGARDVAFPFLNSLSFWLFVAGVALMMISLWVGEFAATGWLFTMYRGRIQFTSPVLWTIGFMVTFVIGGMTGVMLSIPAIDFVLHNSLFLIAHFHNVIIGGVVFGCFAGITYWWPKMFGFTLNETWGKRAFWCWFVGFYVAFMPLYALGFMGATRRMQSYPNMEYQPYFIVAAMGAALIALGILCQVIQIAISIRDRKQNLDLTGDPWDARTLEWETASPVQFYNFATLPKGEELDDFWVRKQRGEAWVKPARYEDIHMPRNTGTGVVIGAFSLVLGFAMVWHIWWLAIIGLVGMIGTFIYRSFDKDVDYWVPAAEVERIENEHRRHLEAQGLVKTEVKA